MQFDTSQQHAVSLAATSPFSMITGGAGTGKTTIIDKIAEALERDFDVRLCAFAGKAAARLKEATGREASTIHRMLGYNGMRFLAPTFPPNTAIIIDEASMISSDLLAEITRRAPGRLVLVGDAAQLPPVGKGQPFHDMLRLLPERVATLDTCYRNSEAVYKAASAIRRGDVPLRSDSTATEKWDCLNTGDAGPTHRLILEYVRKGFIDFQQDIILVPRNGENEDQPCTVRSLNRDIVDIVNARKYDEAFLPGDRVINTKNFSEKNVWNGTTGTVHAVDSDGCIWVELDVPVQTDSGEYESRVLWDKEMRKSLQLAYALTVHKAQGSQYRRVIFPCLARDSYALLDRSLIYTAITRTQEQCVVLGQYSAFVQGIQTVRTKRTVIQELANAV